MMEGQKISLERQWILDRLETLSVKELAQLGAAIISRGQLAALSEKAGEERELAILKMDSNAAKEAVNLPLSLPDYEVICPAGSYEQLGESYLRYEAGRPDLIPYANLEQIGWNYEDSHLGIFIGDCFVVLPRQEPRQFYDGANLDQLPDIDWSLRLPCRMTCGRRPAFPPASSSVPTRTRRRIPLLSARRDTTMTCGMCRSTC